MTLARDINNGTGASATVTATINGTINASTLYIKIESTGPAVSAVSDIQVTGTSSGSALIQTPAPATVGHGTHTSTVTVTACTTDITCASGIVGTPQTIAVTYRVSGMKIDPNRLDFVIDDNSAPAAYTKTLTLKVDPPWSVTSNVPGVTLSATSGTTSSATLSVALDQAVINSLPNGLGTYGLTVTGAVSGVLVPVTVDVRRTLVQFVAPQTVPANQTARLMISGEYMNSKLLTAVRVGGVDVPATAIALSYFEGALGVVSMLVDVPALPAGNHPIQLLTTGGQPFGSSTAQLTVANPLGASAASLAYPDARSRQVTDLYFDSARNSLVAAVKYPGGAEADSQLLRYTYQAGAWSPAVATALPFLSALRPHPSGTGWLATALTANQSSNAIMACDAGLTGCSEQVTGSLTGGRWSGFDYDSRGRAAVLSRPGATTAGSVWLYSVPNRQMAVTTDFPPLIEGVVASNSRRTQIHFGSTASGNVQRYNSMSHALIGANGSSGAVNRLMSDASGDRLLVDARTLINFAGGFSVNLPGAPLAAVISAAGDRIFSYDVSGKVRTFDVNSGMSEVGSGITPASDPGAGANGADMQMRLSPDEHTLFMAGSAGVVVVSLP